MDLKDWGQVAWTRGQDRDCHKEENTKLQTPQVYCNLTFEQEGYYLSDCVLGEWTEKDRLVSSSQWEPVERQGIHVSHRMGLLEHLDYFQHSQVLW